MLCSPKDGASAGLIEEIHVVQAGGVVFFLVVWVFLDTVKQQLPQPLLKA